ncbi:AMP-binding protein [Dactylosporangium sp. NPDC000244]|uniref:AMP-binding protein n=1 Tax=Dactylosporangium sp. NPDC000244 TaxID=3154365 RepID=UPI00333482D9
MSTGDPATVFGHLTARLEDDPDRHLAACGGDWRTVGAVHERALRLAAGLHRLGVRRGDRVASMMPNRDEAVELFFACAALGAIQVPLNVYLKGEFLRYQLGDADPKVVVADGAALPLLADLLGAPERAGATLVAIDEPAAGALAFQDLFADPVRAWPDPAPDDLVCVLYTSGTTGMPKGCMINNGYLMHMPKAHMMHGWFTAGDTSLCPLPLYHGFAISALMDAVVAGCRVAFDPVYSASTLISRAREIGATQFFGVGAMAAALLATQEQPGDTDHGIERAIFIPLAPPVRRRLRERFGIQAIGEGYGQTEVLPATMGDGRSAGDGDRTSAGRALPWLDVRVVDDADRVLPQGATGEVVVRPMEPYSMYAGYWRKEQATLEAWKNLWHHTGDLGFFDTDGALYFVDRKKDALRRRGENVSSVELELAILKHPAIAEVAVHAVPAGVREDEIKACVVLNAGAELGPAELFEYLRQHLPYYAVPRYVEFLGELPKNAVARVLKHRLRDDWNSPQTVDFQALGLVIERSARR